MMHSGPIRRARSVSRRALVAGGAAVAIAAPLSHAVAQKGTIDSGARISGSGQGPGEMLSLVPKGLLPAGDMLFDWFDRKAHFNAAGFAYPLQEIPPVEYLTSVATSDPLIQWAASEEVRDLLGFAAFDVDQVLCVGVPPNTVVIYRGGVFFGDLAPIWEAGGYEPASAGFGDFWTRGQEAEIDFADPLQRMVMARLNNIALLDGETLACATTATLLEAVVRHANEGGVSAAESPDIAPLLERMPEGTANVVGFGGDVFNMSDTVASQVLLGGPDAVAELEDVVAESDAAVGPMPRIRAAIGGASAGVKTGDVGDQSAFLSLLPLSGDHAGNAADVIFWRYEHMTSVVTREPYTDVFEIVNTAETAVDGPVVTVTFSGEDAGRAVWYRMMIGRDVLMFAW
ncbi:MAG TPA: hypothetical protein VNZ55_04620 [Thermomicrobiales bacterium]|nr:hypothetical protein [Thermomicrobiales bacterium]